MNTIPLRCWVGITIIWALVVPIGSPPPPPVIAAEVGQGIDDWEWEEPVEEQQFEPETTEINEIVEESYQIEAIKPVVEATPELPEDLCRLVEGYEWDTRLAWAVCKAESNGNPELIYKKDYHPWGAGPCHGSLGLFQIACGYVGHLSGIDSLDDLYDPHKNMDAAWEVYQRNGNSWKPWGAFTNGRYKQYLNSY